MSVEGLRPPAAPRDHGAAAQLMWVKLADLVIDSSYQRIMTATGRKRLEKIAAEFDWSLFSPVIAAPVAGGKYALIDGQHRATAALLVGETQVPAMIMIATQAGQAKGFAAINGQVVKMTVMATFKAAVAAGEPKAVLAQRIAAECGVRMLFHPQSAKTQRPGDTMAASRILKALEVHGEPALRLALTAIMASRGDKRGLINSDNVRALARLFKKHPMAVETAKKAFAHIDLREARDEAKRDGFESLELDLMRAVERRLLKLAQPRSLIESARPEFSRC